MPRVALPQLTERGASKRLHKAAPPLSARETRSTRGERDESHHREASLNERELASSSFASGYPILPRAVGAALGDPVTFLAFEDWHRTHKSRPDEHEVFESKLLSCEARLQKLQCLSSKLPSPNAAVTALVCRLLRDVVDTLPPALRQVALSILRHIERAVYSDDPSSSADQAHFKEILGYSVDTKPYFALVQHQQAALERLEFKTAGMQELVNTHLLRRSSTLEFIAKLQQQERVVLQQWLFQFWVITYRERQARIEKMAHAILAPTQDIISPFISWRLFVSEQRLAKAKERCSEVDQQASVMANRITQVEIENEEQQGKLDVSLQASSSLREKCAKEQTEHAQLQKLWKETQPELLLSVLSECLEFFFTLIIRQARLSSLSMRQRMAKLDIRPYCGDTWTPDSLSVLVDWVNACLTKAHKWAEEAVTQATADQRIALTAILESATVSNLGDDLADCVALCTVFAVLKSERDVRPILVEDLWPLEETDLDLRAVHLCSCIVELAPTERAKSILSPTEIAAGITGTTSVFLASLFLRFPLLPDVPTSMSEADSARQRLYQVITKMNDLAGKAASEPLEDPTPLLHSGEDAQALATVSVEQLLLRWVNDQLLLHRKTHHRPVENFGSDLQDGLAISLLLDVIAPEVCVNFSTGEERLDQIVAVAARITDFELLSVTALVEGQSDMLACFLAQLLLSRSNLAARPDSLLAMHLKQLESVCSEGLAALSTSGAGQGAATMKLCEELEARWPQLELASQAVAEASKTMQIAHERVNTFLSDTLAHRARGQPKTMLDAKEAREFISYTSLDPESITNALGRDVVDSSATINKVEDVLRRHFRLLRDIYKHYATANPGGSSNGIHLEGLLKLFQDCKLRSKELAPHHLEVIFNEHAETTPGQSLDERFLPSKSFIEVLIHCALVKFRGVVDYLPEQVARLIEDNLKPNAFQDGESIFQKMAYNPKVRAVLDKHAKELKIIFQLYATMDMSTTEAMQHASTMNIAEFHMLLDHTGMLDETLKEDAVQQIFDGIQQNATADGAEDDDDAAGMDDDDEMAFSEFLDGLVAVAAYKHPDPFTPFSTRVNAFILQLFGALRRHWSRKRISPQVDSMLNALQKKLR